MAQDTSRVLRMGVVYRGHVVAERVLDKRADVSIGTRADCTVVVSAKDYPDFPTFLPVAYLHQNAYHVIVPADPNHAISLRGGPHGGFEAVKQQIVTVKGNKCVPAEPFTGGSLTLGDVILMFQFVRGDAVPTVTREETVLRIGLVHESRLLSDQIFHCGPAATIGASPNDALVLPDIDYKGPSAWFQGAKHGNSFAAKLPKDCKLRLAIDGTPMELAEAIAKKVVVQSGDMLHLNLPVKSRGRASLGPYTLLFQVVRQSITVPAMPRKSLPAQIFGPLWADSAWTVSLAISFLLIGSVVAQARLYYETHEKYMQNAAAEEERQNAIYDVVIEEKEEPKPEDKKPEIDIMSEKAKQEEKKEEEKKPVKAPPKEEKPQAQGKQLDPDQLKAQARADIQKKTVAGAFGPQSTKFFAEGGEGEAGDVVAKTFGGGGGEEGEDRGPANGVKLAGEGGGGGTVERVSAGKKGGFGEREAEATKTDGKKEEKAVTVVLKSGGVDGEGEGKTEVAKVIQRKNSAVQRCYEQALRDNPDEGGKVKVTFTVGTAGTITDVSISGASGGFSDCIRTKFTSIRGLPTLTQPQTFSQSYVFSKGG